MLDFLTYSLCPPFSETTDGEHFDTLLGKIKKKRKEYECLKKIKTI